MNLIIYLVIYIIGNILSFGRITGAHYESRSKYFDHKWWNEFGDFMFGCFVTLLSWIGFIFGTVMYFVEKENYFLKFSYKGIEK